MKALFPLAFPKAPPMFRSGRALLGLAAGALALVGASARAAEAPGFPAFPPAGDQEAVVQWLKAQTTVAPETVIAFGPDFVFSLVPETPTRVNADTVRRTVREEVTSASFAATMRGRSSVQVLDFDCRKRRFKPVLISIYEGNNLQGKVERLALADEWTEEKPGTFMAEYIKAVCDTSFKYPLTGQTVAQASPIAAPAPLAPIATAPIPAAPPPAAPPANPPLRPAQPAPRASSIPTAPAPAPRAAPAAPRATAAASGVRVQVGAFNSEAQAKSAMAPLAGGRARETEPVKSGTSTLYRALIGGFASTVEAEAFCKTLSAAKHACIVRK